MIVYIYICIIWSKQSGAVRSKHAADSMRAHDTQRRQRTLIQITLLLLSLQLQHSQLTKC